jgi:hypothetical protein
MKNVVAVVFSFLSALALGGEIVTYEQFGAKGDGKSDDRKAVVAAHAHANKIKAKVRANDAAVYFIGKGAECAIVKTDVDFGKARFIIDDVDVEKRNSPLFSVESYLSPFRITSVKSLDRSSVSIGRELPYDCLVQVQNSNIRRYIRFGLNQNKGKVQQEVFVAKKNGEVDKTVPLLWDYPAVTFMKAYPIDEEPLNIKGGHFTTIANQCESKYNYHTRGFVVNRSNVTISGVRHDVTGELDHGAPYSAFISIVYAYNVTVSDCILTGHKVYTTIGSAKKPVAMGSYDLSANNSINTTVKNCRQTNDINDGRYWGIFGSNYCKNMVFENCEFSRFDAHEGVYNATIRNCKFGHQGMNAIGAGLFLVENTTVYSRTFSNLRQDYGSTWKGEFVFRNCKFVPLNGRKCTGTIIGGNNKGMHDFGYECFMPAKITIDGMEIDDSSVNEGYSGAYIFANFNSDWRDDDYKELYPYKYTSEIVLKNIKTKSGKALNICPNPRLFKNLKIN